MKRTMLLGLVLGAACLVTVSPAFGAATLTVNNSAAMNGTTFGLQVTLDGAAGGPAYVQDATPANEATFRGLFWLQPRTLVNTSGNFREHTVYSIHNPGDGVAVVRVDMRKLDPSGTVRVRAVCREDDGSYQRTAFISLGAAGSEPERQVVLEWANGAGTGFCRITRQANGGTLTEEVLNLDNDTLSIKRARLGAVVGIDAQLSGNYDVDQYESFR